MSTIIHTGAFVDPEAKLGTNVEIMPGAVVTKWAELGDNVIVHPGAVVGGDPQYLAFERDTPSWVRVGADSVIRECATLNRSIHADAATTVGERCFMMACSHVGHDCVMADDVVLANNVMLAGHVDVASNVFIGGGAGIHQFVRIGTVAMVAGLARITKDIPPYCMVAERDSMSGLNLVGIKRRSWTRETISEVKAIYHTVMQPIGNLRKIAAEQKARSTEAKAFLDFFTSGKRGFARPN